MTRAAQAVLDHVKILLKVYFKQDKTIVPKLKLHFWTTRPLETQCTNAIRQWPKSISKLFSQQNRFFLESFQLRLDRLRTLSPRKLINKLSVILFKHLPTVLIQLHELNRRWTIACFYIIAGTFQKSESTSHASNPHNTKIVFCPKCQTKRTHVTKTIILQFFLCHYLFPFPFVGSQLLCDIIPNITAIKSSSPFASCT